MTRGAAVWLFIIVALATGQAAHWFIGGEYRDHSHARNALVGAQLAGGTVAMIWLALRRGISH